MDSEEGRVGGAGIDGGWTGVLGGMDSAERRVGGADIDGG